MQTTGIPVKSLSYKSALNNASKKVVGGGGGGGGGDLHHFTMPTTQNCLQTNSMSSVRHSLLFCRALFMGVFEW